MAYSLRGSQENGASLARVGEMRLFLPLPDVCIHACMCVCVCVFVSMVLVFLYVFSFVCIHVNMSGCMNVGMYVMYSGRDFISFPMLYHVTAPYTTGYDEKCMTRLSVYRYTT